MRWHTHSGHLHHPSQTRLSRTLHAQQRRQVVQEHGTNPHGHAMRPWSPEVPVDDDDGDQNGHGVHDESEQQILGDEWQHQRCGWQNLRNEEQEHNQ